MRIHVVGGGGREHALVWALARHGHTVSAAPGNPGIAAIAAVGSAKPDDIAGQLALAVAVDLVVVGPEGPLAAGLADALVAAGIPCFGPPQAGAVLEASKVWAKRFFARHGIPTAAFAVCADLAEVDRALADLGGALVVKADGLAAGKGVVVCSTTDEARVAARAMLEEGAFGEAGRRVVIERRLVGREASILALTDGTRVALLASAEDHKAVFDGDLGPNTGGMGAISPTPVVTPEILARVRREILEPTVRGLAADGIPYRGVLYAGLMLSPDGKIDLLEYNCRFGDPEAEPLMARFAEDPAPWLLGAARGQLPDGEPAFTARAAACVVLTAPGYPGTPQLGGEIRGVADAATMPDVLVFHAGTRRDGDRLLVAGGRVLAVTALGDDLEAARARAYEACARISFDGMHYRRDIGRRT